jgi:hypothetical protein
MKKIYNFSIGKYKIERPFGRLRHGLKDNIKMELKVSSI